MLNESFNKHSLSQFEMRALAGLARIDIRTHDRIMSIVMKALSDKEPNPQRLADVYRALFTQRSILQNKSRDGDLLLLRQLKSIYTR